MKKNFKYFSITWLVGFVLFNAVTFLIPNKVFGSTRFDKATFWIAHAFITISFFIQLITAYRFVKADGNEKTFLHIPLLQGKLDRMVKKLQNQGVENTPYADKDWK